METDNNTPENVANAAVTTVTADINKNPSIIKESQKEVGHMDVLVCGGCHSVFHFIQDFQNHRQKNECTEQSSIRDGNVNEPKPQVWAFLLWKNTQNKANKNPGKPPDKDNSWIMYQKWCKLEQQDRETWITAGKNVQTFTKLSTTKIPIMAPPNTNKRKTDEVLEEGEIRLPKAQGGAKLTTVRSFVKSDMNKSNLNKTEDDLEDESEEEDDIDSESELDTEEEAELAEMEREAMRQHNKKTAITNSQSPQAKNTTSIVTSSSNTSISQTKTSDAAGIISKSTPTTDRSSRIAKRTGKAPLDSNGDTIDYVVEKILAKRYNPRKKVHEYLLKWEGYPHEQNTWEPAENMNTCKHLLEEFERNLAKQKEKKAAQAAAEQASKRLAAAVAVKQTPPTPPILSAIAGRPVRNSKIKALGQVKAWCGSMTEDETGKRKASDSDGDDDPAEKKSKRDTDGNWSGGEWESTGLNGSDLNKTKSSPAPVLVAHAKGVVKVDPTQMPNLKSGVYIMSKDSGLVKVDDESVSSNNKPNIMRVKTPGQPTAQIRIVQKGESQQSGIVRMSTGMSATAPGHKGGAVIQKSVTPQKRIINQPTVRVVQRKPVPVTKTPPMPIVKQKPPTPIATGNSIHMEFHTQSEESSDDELPDPFPKDLPPPEPDSPPRPLTLCPLTGKVLSRAEGERTPEPSPPPPEEPAEVPAEVSNTSEQATTLASLVNTEEINKIGPTTVQIATATNNETDMILSDASELASDAPLMITGEDGTIYQVAGQDENGQTLLVAQGADGEQQCVYLAAGGDDGETSMLTLDPETAAAMGDESVAQLVTDDQAVSADQQLMVNTEGDDSQVVAQVVKAELPSPGGSRKVVLLLPNGTLAITTVDAAQYSALELE